MLQVLYVNYETAASVKDNGYGVDAVDRKLADQHPVGQQLLLRSVRHPANDPGPSVPGTLVAKHPVQDSQFRVYLIFKAD